jgi:hypothetical protein
VDPVLLGLLDDLADVDDCDLDGAGHCQAHGWFAAEPCPQARVKRVLAEAGMRR